MNSFPKPIGIASTVRDITARKREAEEASRMVTVVRDSNDAITIQDFEGRITAWNRGAELMYGYSEAEALEMNIERLTAPGKVDEQKDFVSQLVAGEAVTSLETQRVTKDGRVLDVWMTVTKLVDKVGKPIGIASTERDITKAKQAAETLRNLNAELEHRVAERTVELLAAKEEADVANQAKSDFLANMSHELRTPLNSVIGFSEVLEQEHFGKLNEKQREYVKDISESGLHLLSLINDILDLSKIEAGKLEPEWCRINIEDLLENSLILIKEKCFKHGIALGIDIAEPAQGLEIVADERRIKQIMYNLLSNAAKFTPKGGRIYVQAKLSGDSTSLPVAGPATLEISVSDTGVGIAPENQKRIFDEFYQVKGGTLDKTPGTGLGLSIVKQLVAIHGGRVWMESEGLGRGSRFTFAIPVDASGAQSAKQREKSRNIATRISAENSLPAALSMVIRTAESEQWQFALCGVYLNGSTDNKYMACVLDMLRRIKRGNDVVIPGQDDCTVVILFDCSEDDSKAVSARLTERLQVAFAKQVVCSSATYPADGRTAEALIAKLREGREG